MLPDGVLSSIHMRHAWVKVKLHRIFEYTINSPIATIDRVMSDRGGYMHLLVFIVPCSLLGVKNVSL